MPKFKIGDCIMYNNSDTPRSDYYKVTAFRGHDYVVDIYDTATNFCRRTNCIGAINAVDEDFILYHPSHLSQIRRP